MKKIFCIILVVIIGMLTGCAGDTAVEDSETNEALIPSPMTPNDVAANPYMANSENSVHNDNYSSDVTNAVLPLGIGSQLELSLETENPQAPSAAFYDEDGNAVTPYLGGVAIVDMTGKTITRQGAFVPSKHDNQNYRVQISYSFVDSRNNIVLPTSHGHVIVLQTTDEDGNVLPVFKKIIDVDVSSQAVKKLGDDIDKNLLSIVYDYSGNLWFVTGGFCIVPESSPAGFLGYISHEYMEKALNGEEVSAEDYLHFYRLSDGEGAENGISSGEQGAVILTNKACYMLNANDNADEDGVDIVWKTEYDSNGTNDAEENSDYTGGGLAYGSGTTPTLTKDLVLFTDNLDPINLLALSAETGDLVAKTPVLDELGEDVPVSVENSILVYSGNQERASVLVCNWFGAGNAGLSNPDADSSVQTYDNIYDTNWMEEGNKYIAPGVERVDIVKDGDGYKAEKVWFRDDIRDTSMIKLSTATGYLYGYWQNMDTDMWCYEVLDFATGETAYELPVSKLPGYNNVAVGMIADVKGNSLYCPTNNMEMVRWQDDFVSLPDTPAKKIAPDNMERYYLTAEEFKDKSGSEATPATYLMRATAGNVSQETTFDFLVNGLEGKVSEYDLFYEDTSGKLNKFSGSWSLVTSDGEKLDSDKTLSAEEQVKLRVTMEDGGQNDLDNTEKTVKLSVILAKAAK